ncbi:MAG: hypothetical protein IKQ29_02890 [Bacilli bacterium]|nr:hypothetical protein [Bacilli bacterium]
MKNKYNVLNNFTFLYLYIPTIIFLLGFVKYIYSIPLSILLTIVLVKEFINNKEYYTIKRIKNYFKKNYKQLIILLIITLVYVLLAGIGGYVYQNDDHIYRNTFLRYLVENKWPIYEYNGDIFFTYYYAFWLPAALIGKVFSLKIAFFFLYIWSVMGVYLFFNYIKDFYKKNYLIPIVLFILFSGLDIIEQLIKGSDILFIIQDASHIEWATKFQFSSFTTQLFWVYNQCIPAWLLTYYILSLEDNRIIGLLIAMSLIFCTLPTISLAIIALYKIFFDNKDKLSVWLKNTFTWENILVGIPILLIFGTFCMSNAAGGVIKLGIKKDFLDDYYITIMFEFLIYYLIIFKYYKKDILFYITLVILLICPFISINGYGDFCMRVSIPCLLILFMYIVNLFNNINIKKDKLIFRLLIFLFILGSITPINEILRTIRKTSNYKGIEYVELYNDEDFEHNFYGYTEDSLFCKYFIKK